SAAVRGYVPASGALKLGINLQVGGKERSGHGVAGEVFHFVLFGKIEFPFKEADGDVHLRKRNVRISLFREGRARMQKNERDSIRACGTETRAQQRHAVAIGTLDGLHLFTGHIGSEDARAGGQIHFQKWLGLIFHDEFDLGEGFALGGNERGDRGAFGNGGEDAGIGEARPFKGERGRFVGLAVITKRGLQRVARKSAEIRIHFLDVQALQAAGFIGRELESALAFHENFAGFALRILEGQDGGGCLGVVDGPFERNEKLVSAGPMARDLEKKDAVLNFTGFQRGAVDGGDFKTLGNGQGELSRVALHNIEIDQRRDLQIGFRHGNERFHIRKETHLAGYDRSHDFARIPPDAGGLAGNQRSLDFRVAIFGAAMRDDAVIELDVGALAGNAQREADTSRRRNGKREGGAPGFDGDWETCVERDGEFRFAGQNGGVRAIFEEQRQRFGAVARVQDRCARDERDLGGVGGEGLAFKFNGAENTIIDDAQLQLGMFEEIRQRGSFGLLAGAIGEGEKTVIFVKREGDVAGSRRWWIGFLLRKRRQRQNERYSQELEMTVHLPPAFFSCW